MKMAWLLQTALPYKVHNLSMRRYLLNSLCIRRVLIIVPSSISLSYFPDLLTRIGLQSAFCFSSLVSQNRPPQLIKSLWPQTLAPLSKIWTRVSMEKGSTRLAWCRLLLQCVLWLRFINASLRATQRRLGKISWLMESWNELISTFGRYWWQLPMATGRHITWRVLGIFQH